MNNATVSVSLFSILCFGCVSAEGYPIIDTDDGANAILSTDGTSSLSANFSITSDPGSRWFILRPAVDIRRDGSVANSTYLSMEPVEVTLDEDGFADVALELDPSSDLDHLCDQEWDEAELRLRVSSMLPTATGSFSSRGFGFELSVSCTP